MNRYATHRAQRSFIALCAFLLVLPGKLWAGGVYEEPAAFLARAFGKDLPEPQLLWLSDTQQAAAADILGHRYASLRVRYWLSAGRGAWILEEIGKEEPITVGIVVGNEQGHSKIESVQVLEFRESRGDEVRHMFFTKRFKGAGLTEQLRLDRHIDNITGASMSVRAMVKVANLALYFHEQVSR